MIRTLIRSCLLALVASAIGCAAPTRTVTAAPPGVSSVSLMTYNVNYGIAGDPETLRAIEQPDVDVVLLQEVNQPWEQSLRKNLAAKYPHQAYHGDDGYAGGFAVLSKWPIESVDPLRKVDWFAATRAIIDTPIGRLQALNVHLRPPRGNSGGFVSGYFTTPKVREREIRTYEAELDDDLPAVVVGDFNEGDSGRAARWLRSNGYQDALLQFAPRASTWRWPLGFVTLRGRYDHVFYTDALYPLKCEVHKAGRSDHLPVVAVFSLKDDVLHPPQRGQVATATEHK